MARKKGYLTNITIPCFVIRLPFISTPATVTTYGSGGN